MALDFAKLFDYQRDAVLALADGAVVYRNGAADALFPGEKLAAFAAALPAPDGDAPCAVRVLDFDAVLTRVEGHVLCTIRLPESDADPKNNSLFRSAFTDIRNALSILSILTTSVPRQLQGAPSASVDRYTALLRKTYFGLRHKVTNLDEIMHTTPTVSSDHILLDMGDLCADLLDTVNALTGEGCVKLQLAERAGSRLLVQGSADRLHQMLLNVLSNSLKYTPANGNVVVSLAATDTHVVITVADTGTGIPSGKLPRLFKGYAYPPDLTDEKAGSGIGLALAEQVARQHGGMIVVESAPEKGTRVIISLPVARDSATLRSPMPPYDALPRILTELSDVLPLEAYAPKYAD